MPKKPTKKKEEEPLDLKLEDVGCPICLEILIEPITMPCEHRLCKPCFSKNLEETSLNCPFCKKRVGTWHRRAKDVNSLIDQRLWSYLQDKFRDQVEARLRGETAETDAATDGIFYVEFSHDICENGQIGREFATQIEQLERENEERRNRENLKSQALIKKIQEEELMAGVNGGGTTSKENRPPPPASTPVAAAGSHAHSSSQADATPPAAAAAVIDVSDIQETPSLEDVVPNSFTDEFMQMQKLAEERIRQAKLDEELAKKLQAEEEEGHGGGGGGGVSAPRPASPRRPIVTTPLRKVANTAQLKRPKGQMTIEEAMNAKKRKVE